MFAVNIAWPKCLYNPGQKSLGQYCNIHIFLSFLGSLILKTVILFETFVQFSLSPTLYNVQSWNSEKIQDTHVQHCLWGEGRVGPVWTGKCPRNASVPRLLSRIVERFRSSYVYSKHEICTTWPSCPLTSLCCTVYFYQKLSSFTLVMSCF